MPSTRLHQELRGLTSTSLLARAVRSLSQQVFGRAGDLEKPGIGYQSLSW